MRFDRRGTAPVERCGWSSLAGLAALLLLALTFAFGAKFKTAASPPPLRADGPPTPPADSLTIAIARDGAISAAGRALTPAELEELARQEVASHGGRPERVTVVVLVDPRARSATAVPVLDRLKKAGLSQVQMALNPGP